VRGAREGEQPASRAPSEQQPRAGEEQPRAVSSFGVPRAGRAQGGAAACRARAGRKSRAHRNRRQPRAKENARQFTGGRQNPAPKNPRLGVARGRKASPRRLPRLGGRLPRLGGRHTRSSLGGADA
jgi:hypothetical protein